MLNNLPMYLLNNHLKPPQNQLKTTFEVGMHPLSKETKSSGRKELPEDLFTASYVSAPAAVPGWQNGLPHGMGFGLQCNPNGMHATAFPSTAKANPFDLNSDTTPAQAPSVHIWEINHTSMCHLPENVVKILYYHCGPQGIGGFGSDELISSSLSTTQKPTGGHSASNPPNSFPTMGANPFG